MSSGTDEAKDEANRTFELAVVPPFDLGLTVEVLRRRQRNRLEALVDGEYRRVLALASGEALVGVRQTAADRIAVRVLEGMLPAARREELVRIVTHMLGLSVDVSPFAERVAGNELLTSLVHRLAGMKPPCFPSIWETAGCVIPFQQVSLDAAISVLNRLVEALGNQIEHEGQIYHGFPSPQRVLDAPEATLRACGLSAAKARTLRNVAGEVLGGTLSSERLARMEDAEALARLRQLPGIGPWSAQVMLLRGFRRLAIFPQGDSGAQRNLTVLFGGDAAAVAASSAALLDHLGTWRGYLYFVLLGRNLLQRGVVG